MNTCGMCAHGGLFSQDITKRICRGGPPQIVLVPTVQGPATQNMFPLVHANDLSCGAFELKVVTPPLDKLDIN